jgi:hypothetical protein
VSITIAGNIKKPMAIAGRIACAVILMVHLMVGCCGHHAHACESHVQSPSLPNAPASDDDCPDHAGLPLEHSHHGSHDCQGTSCSVVLQNRTTAELTAEPSEVFAAAIIDGLNPSVDTVSVQRTLPACRLPSVRLHLANQILLI